MYSLYTLMWLVWTLVAIYNCCQYISLTSTGINLTSH